MLIEKDITKKVEVRDKLTGELIESAKVTQSAKAPDISRVPEFIFVYDKLMRELFGSGLVATKLILWMAFNMNKKTCMVFMGREERVRASLDLGLSPDSIKNELGPMCEKGWIEKINRGEYRVNVEFVWKGDRRDRVKFIKSLINSKNNDDTYNDFEEDGNMNQ